MRRNFSQYFLISVLSLLAVAGAFKTAAGEEASVHAGSEWKAPARAAKKQNPVPLDANSVAQGKAVYIRECLSCHGNSGRGDGPQAKDLEKSPGNLTNAEMMNPHTDGDLFWKITEGNKPMPSYKKTLSDDERWQVVHYIRGLASKKGD